MGIFITTFVPYLFICQLICILIHTFIFNLLSTSFDRASLPISPFMSNDLYFLFSYFSVISERFYRTEECRFGGRCGSQQVSASMPASHTTPSPDALQHAITCPSTLFIFSHLVHHWGRRKILEDLKYCTAQYCTVLYCTVLYCTVLYCTVLYCSVLCCTASIHIIVFQCPSLLSVTVAFSVLNGRISRELGFEKTFVPPGPGDEGVAVGCALYGLQVEHLCCSLCVKLPLSAPTCIILSIWCLHFDYRQVDGPYGTFDLVSCVTVIISIHPTSMFSFPILLYWTEQLYSLFRLFFTHHFSLVPSCLIPPTSPPIASEGKRKVREAAGCSSEHGKQQS